MHLPIKTLRITLASYIASAALLLGAPDQLSNHEAPIYHSVEECIQGMRSSRDVVPSSPLNDEFELICWNIKKGSKTGWKQELKDLAENTQIVLLQEAIYVEEMKRPNDGSFYWSFAPGYETKKHSSGVMTISRMQPNFFCVLDSKEPWLRSPKKTSVVEFSLGPNEHSLLIVNMHAINFTFGIKAFARQLNEIAPILEAHSGPIIFSGDLNTWKQERKDVLFPFISQFDLTEVGFDPDNRSQKMGHPVDYIFTRGLEVKQSRAIKVDTSDHNPLVVTLALPANDSI